MSNYELMQVFLDIVKELSISNPVNKITENTIYSILMGFNIRSEQYPYQDVTDIWDSIIKYYDNNQNIKVYIPEKMQKFLVLSNGSLKGNEIKLYVPLDKRHLEKGSKEIFNFISGKNIAHQSKIAGKVRNDNIVIRVNTLDDAKEIINFVNSNDYIKEGLLKPNPFLPSIYGVGVTMDNNYSYNSILSKLIYSFIHELKDKNRLDLFTVDNLSMYIKGKIDFVDDLDLKDIFTLLSKVTTKDFKFEDFSSFASMKVLDKYDSNRNRITDSKFYFERAVELTNKSYPKKVRQAIEAYIDGNAKGFTNKDDVRFSLMKYVDSRNVVNIMRSKLIEHNKPVPMDIHTLIDSYVNVLENKELKTNINYIIVYNLIKSSYVDTFNKYGYKQSSGALKSLILSGKTKNFTDDNGYRTELQRVLKSVDYREIKKIVLNEIDLDNLDVNDIDEIVSRFSQKVINELPVNENNITM